MNWEIVFQAIGVVVAAVVAVSQVANRLPKSRARLKHDLEILGMLDPNDPKYNIVRAHVDHSIERIFESSTSEAGRIRGRFVIHQWDDFVFGVVALFGGLVWTLYLVQDGFSWWSLLSGFIAFGGFGGILNGFEEKQKFKGGKGSQSEAAADSDKSHR